jgi:hypothetical protein
MKIDMHTVYWYSFPVPIGGTCTSEESVLTNYISLSSTDPARAVAGPDIGRFVGHGVTIKAAAKRWMETRGDLCLVISQKRGVTSLRFRKPVRGLLGRGKSATPIDPLVKDTIREFATALAHEHGLATNFCSMNCKKSGHALFIVTFT